MLYDIKVTAANRGPIPASQAADWQIRNILDSYLADRVEFTLTIKPHVHEHRWWSYEQTLEGASIFTCNDSNCEETFRVSQTMLQAIFTGEERAREGGL